MHSSCPKLEKDGFLIRENVLDEKTVLQLLEALSNLKLHKAPSIEDERIYGVRDLINLSDVVKEFSQSPIVKELATNFLDKKAKVVRAIYFDKTPEANWKVPWHQDLTIAVKEKRETAGFTAWTQKANITHAQPPVKILERMLTLRFHLDDSDENNGALKVIPASHNKGRLSAEEIINARKANETRVCSVKKGGCLVMRPLLIHSSSAGTKPKHRRVIHFEFSADELPNNLRWYDS
ncbi:MAG: protein involved in biosynthesis of mitomycin antibiotics/polyketide fumonisin [Acidobacteria bacterium]|nr:protein involved in biosynthesis of mitomycin antibiotics/polyketide fumonisin [Acidobacteriota bacterium]